MGVGHFFIAVFVRKASQVICFTLSNCTDGHLKTPEQYQTTYHGLQLLKMLVHSQNPTFFDQSWKSNHKSSKLPKCHDLCAIFGIAVFHVPRPVYSLLESSCAFVETILHVETEALFALNLSCWKVKRDRLIFWMQHAQQLSIYILINGGFCQTH